MSKADPCTIGLHPRDKDTQRVICACGDFADKQCCDAGWYRLTGYGPCPKHKCGPRVGCRCPLPEAVTA